MSIKLQETVNMLDILNKPITFSKKKAPIPADMRPIWRISIIVMLLKLHGRARRMNENKIHFMVSIIRDNEKWEIFKSVIKENEFPYDLAIRFDPSVNRALLFAESEGLIKYFKGKSIELTDKGDSYAEKILDDDEIFILEKAFLKNFKKNDFSENVINSILNLKL